MALMLLLGTSSAWADGDASGSIGVYLKVNGTSTWYKVYNPGSWGMSCSGYAFDSASEIPSAFGDITSSLSLEGVGVIGWTNSGNDWVAGKISYTITPGSVSGEYKVGNYGSAGSGKTQVQCTSDNNRLTGYKSTVNLISGLGVGDYTLKITPYAQMQWNDGSNSGTYSSYTRTAKSSTFTIPGYSTTSGTLDFDEVEIDSNSSMSKSTTHYGSKTTATYSISGTNASEFIVTACTATSVTVKFTPTSAGSKTAKVTITDAYSKTYTLNVTGTGKQSCTTPTFTIDGLTSICEEGEYTYAIDDAVNPNATYAWTNGLLNNATSTGTSYTFTAGTGTKTGTISVVATDATCTYEQSIDVSQIAKVTTAGTITGTSTIEVGQTSQLSVDGASTGTASWSSDSEDIATVDANGLVTAESAGTATITYTVEPSLTGCGSTQSTTYTITVIEACAAPIVTIKDVEQLSCSSLKVTYKVTSNNGQSCGYTTDNANKIRIFDSQANAEGTTLFIGSLLHTATINEDEEVTIPSNYMWTQPGDTYYVRVGAENSQGWGWSNIMEVTIPTNETLTNVTINPVDAVCKGQSTTLTLSNYSIGDIQWQKKVGDVWNNIAGATAVSYTTEALNAEMQYRIVLTDNNCNVHIQPITVSVTEPPVITSITGDDNVTIGDNVSLTANITGGYEEIEWAVEGVNSSEITTNGTSCSFVATDITTYVATATVKSASCTVSKSHNVVVNDENCNDVVVYDNEHVEIWLSSTLNKTMYLHRWYENGDQDTGITTWPGAGTTKSGEYYKWITTSSGNIGYIFHDNTGTNKSSDANRTLEKGYRYYFTFNGGTGSATFNKSERISTTTPAQIIAPAVKTVSFETTPGEGDINFSGQIVKTGCDNSLTYGFEYKEVGADNWKQIVLGTDQDQNAGFAFSDNSITELDGTFVVRAFITNDHSTQYGAEITKDLSTTQEPVRTATIQLTESDGTPVANDKKYCVGETAYIMVESDVKYTDISWKSQQGVDIVQTRLMNMYQFVVKGNDNIVVLLSNKYNVTPAESNTIEVYTFADPVLPTVSLNKVSICSNDAVGATVKLTNVAKGQTYQLYQQIDNGDETFTEQTIGSAKTQTEEVTDKTELVLHTLTNTAATGKYFVKTYTAQCAINLAATQPFTFTVVDAAEVFISLEPISAETTPWMPAKFTVSASDAYTLNVTKGNPAEAATEAEVSQNGNNVSVKIPLPEGTQHVTGQYQNVTFPQDATTSYTVTAKLVSTGGEDNPCATPASATITLTPYVEECTIGHE